MVKTGNVVSHKFFTLINCAPSAVPDVPAGVINPLRRGGTSMEFGLVTEEDA